jgi:hypothetical protein
LLDPRVLTHLEQREDLVLATLDPRVDGLGVETLREVSAGWQLTNAHAGSLLVEDNSVADELVGGTFEVVAGTAAVGKVEGRLALVVTGGENLDEVGLTAASAPAGALAVLASTRDLAVEGPDGGHVGVETSGTVEGHLEAEEEDLVGAGEALVGDVLGTGETASLVARLAGPDGELLVALEEAGLEDLGLGAAAGTLGVQVREGVAPGAVSLSVRFALPG